MICVPDDYLWYCLSFDKTDTTLLLRDHVGNLIDLVEDQYHTFHFVRYGPNVLKLRINLRKVDTYETVRSTTVNYCTSKNLRFKVEHYQPQVDRYGGPYGMQIAERQFHISSTTTLHLIKQYYSKIRNGLSANLGLQLALGTISAFGFMPEDAKRFFSDLTNEWLTFLVRWRFKEDKAFISALRRLRAAQRRLFETHKNNLQFLVDTVVKQISKLEFSTNPWLGVWYREHRRIYAELLKIVIDGKLLQRSITTQKNIDELSTARLQLCPVIGSFIHLTNNRLGIDVMEEPYLAYVLARTLSQTLQKKDLLRFGVIQRGMDSL